MWHIKVSDCCISGIHKRLCLGWRGAWKIKNLSPWSYPDAAAAGAATDAASAAAGAAASAAA